MSKVDHSFARGQEHGAWAFLPEHPLEGNPHGPLFGLTFSAKDLFKIANWPQKASTYATLPEIPASRVVLDLLENGASCVGLTHLHEIALGITGLNPIAGQAKNPHDMARISGGSSSGAALSVALHECDFALGTDTGGSIRIPAALCGVVGFKPTREVYSREGVLTLSQTCDHVGTLARDVATLERVHVALHGTESLNPHRATPRFGFWNVPNWLSPAAWQAFERVTSSLAALPFSFPEVLDTYSPIVQYEAARFHSVALEQENPSFSLPTLELLRRGQSISDETYQAAMAQRQSVTEQLERLFEHFDILLAPAVPDIAPMIGQNFLELPSGSTPLRQAFLRLTTPFNLAGLPVICLPLETGLVWTGIQVIGAKGQDREVLRVAAALSWPNYATCLDLTAAPLGLGRSQGGPLEGMIENKRVRG